MRIIIIGAGIKGLFVARELGRSHNVTVLERNNHIGGKILTYRENGAFIEMGAMRFLQSQNEIRSLISGYDLKVSNFIEEDNRRIYDIAGQRGSVLSMNLGMLVTTNLINSDTYMESGLNLDSSFPVILEHTFKNVGTEKEEELVRDFLDDKTVNISQIALRKCAATVLTLRNGDPGLHLDVSVKELKSILELYSGQPLYLSHGFDQLVDAVYNSLPDGIVRKNFNVQQIVTTETHCTVYSDDNSVQADIVVLACPSLQKISFQPSLPVTHLNAIKELQNVPTAMKCGIRFTKKFWENNGVVGGTSWIYPSEISQIHYPQSSPDLDGYLMLYITATSMIEWMKKSELYRVEYTISTIEKLFPSVDVRSLYNGYKEVCWIEDGAYMLHSVQNLQNLLSPISNRLVFSPIPRGWIDDALLDGKNILKQIANIIKPNT
jgi:monoamine oxidase